MTALEQLIQRTLELEAKATPGPWTLSMSNQNVRVLEGEYVNIRKTSEDGINDNVLICNLRNVIKPLCEIVQILSTSLDERYADATLDRVEQLAKGVVG